MTGQDILKQLRLILGERSQNRWTDNDLLQQASVIGRQLSLELDFPEATWVYPVVGSARQYQLQTLTKILRVYIATAGGSYIELYPTDIPTLQGDILQTYDNSSGTVVGAPIQSPQWLTQPPSAYPMPNVSIGGTVGTKYPWQNTATGSQRPAYALRGGYLIVLPPDIAATGDNIVVDVIPTPPDLDEPQDVSIFPRTFMMCLVWGVVKFCRLSDQNAQYQAADVEFDKELVRLNLWRQNQLQQNKPKAFVPRTVRTDFSPGFGGWGGDW